jgi:hypothetical protein
MPVLKTSASDVTRFVRINSQTVKGKTVGTTDTSINTAVKASVSLASIVARATSSKTILARPIVKGSSASKSKL